MIQTYQKESLVIGGSSILILVVCIIAYILLLKKFNKSYKYYSTGHVPRPIPPATLQYLLDAIPASDRANYTLVTQDSMGDLDYAIVPVDMSKNEDVKYSRYANIFERMIAVLGMITAGVGFVFAAIPMIRKQTILTYY